MFGDTAYWFLNGINLDIWHSNPHFAPGTIQHQTKVTPTQSSLVAESEDKSTPKPGLVERDIFKKVLLLYISAGFVRHFFEAGHMSQQTLASTS